MLEKDGLAVDTVTVSGTTEGSDESYDAESCRSKSRGSCLRFWRICNAFATRTKSVPQRSDPYYSITRTLDQSPTGYSQIATFQSSDRNFLQYRGFSYLHSRVLLALQNDIEILERQLDKLDSFDKSSAGDKDKLSSKNRDDFECRPENIKSGEFHVRFKKTRPQILVELKTKLMEYDEVLLKTREVAVLQKPSRRDYDSVRDWFIDEKPLVESEAEFIKRKEDIITLRSGRESSAFDSLVEGGITKIDKWLMASCGCNLVQRIFMTPELQQKTSNKRLHYYTPARVDRLVNVIITLIIFVLMVLPVVALYEMSDVGRATPFEAIGVLIVFTLLFGCAMSSVTRATRQELFGASAAYCAVLVVFISNFGTQVVQLEGYTP